MFQKYYIWKTLIYECYKFISYHHIILHYESKILKVPKKERENIRPQKPVSTLSNYCRFRVMLMNMYVSAIDMCAYACTSVYVQMRVQSAVPERSHDWDVSRLRNKFNQFFSILVIQ